MMLKIQKYKRTANQSINKHIRYPLLQIRSTPANCNTGNTNHKYNRTYLHLDCAKSALYPPYHQNLGSLQQNGPMKYISRIESIIIHHA